MPQSLTLVSWGKVLEVGLRLLLGQERQLHVIRSPVELAKGLPPADVVVVDVPAQGRRPVCEQIRRHHRGRLLVLLDPGDSGQDLPPDPNQTLLTRPFFVYELSAALAGSGPTQPALDPATQPSPVLPRTTLARRARSRLDSCGGVATQLVLGLMRSWRERRLVGLSAISLTAVLLVGVAVVLISQGAGCGSACDELTGVDFTSPFGTVTPAGQDRTTSGAGLVGPTTTDSSVDPSTGGRSRGRAATTSRPGIARTTAGSSATPSPTSAPDPTRPPPTAAPTTAPTTTSPKPSTTIATTTTTTPTTTTRPGPPHP